MCADCILQSVCWLSRWIVHLDADLTPRNFVFVSYVRGMVFVLCVYGVLLLLFVESLLGLAF